MNKSLLSYLEYTNQPWGKMFYSLIYAQLPELKNKCILDFGSGFGISANHYCKNNHVIAIEPNKAMIKLSTNNGFEQITGSIDKLVEIKDNSVDVIFCHNVFEYIDDREKLMNEFARILKSDGFLSVAKHNRTGRIMQKVISEYEIDNAKAMISGSHTTSKKFGEIRIYPDDDLVKWSDSKLCIDKIYGIAAFYNLQNNSIKYSDEWFSSMLELEMTVSEIDEFMHLASYHHIILKTNKF